MAKMTTAQPIRPSLGGDDDAARQATEAVTALVEELQAGWDASDADVTDHSCADDILWGSPFGATLQGYDELHAIHVALKKEGRGGRASRFEIVSVLAPSDDVVLAQVRRTALDDDGHPLEATSEVTGAFSEMALYVLVRRGGTWWLAAGQNTIVRSHGLGAG
jgi:uncharacterized protein (TIGR02246 family)